LHPSSLTSKKGTSLSNSKKTAAVVDDLGESATSWADYDWIYISHHNS
jgi:hypothetical protein